MTGPRLLVLVSDVDEKLASTILKLHQHSDLQVIYRRTGRAFGPYTPQLSCFSPLNFDEDHARRVSFYEKAMRWSWATAHCWAARRDSLMPDSLRIGPLRLTYDQFLLENLYLTAAYLEALVAEAQVERILLVAPISTEVQAVVKLLAGVRGLSVEHLQPSPVSPSTTAPPTSHRRAELSFLANLPRWLRTRSKLSSGGVILEAGSIQSARNIVNLVRSLSNRGIDSYLVGLPSTKDSGERRRFYEIEWIARTIADEGMPPSEAVNLLSFTPWLMVIAAPLILVLQRWQRCLLRRLAPRVEMFGIQVRLTWLADSLLSQFDLDMLIAVLCRHAASRLGAVVRPRAVIITNPVTLTGRSSFLARYEATRIVTVQDGTISNEIVHRPAGPYHVACVWGEAFADILVQTFGHERCQILVAGPQREVFAKRSRGAPRSHGGHATSAAKTILVAHQPSTFGAPTSDFLLTWLVQEAELAGWQILVRPHPRANLPELAAQIAAFGSTTVKLTSRAPLSTELATSRVFVAEYSTTIFEAWACRHPCLVVDIESRSDMALLHGVLGESCITSRDELRRHLITLMTDDVARDALVRKQDRLLDHYFLNVPMEVAAEAVVSAALGDKSGKER
jgi:hypothetical protein